MSEREYITTGSSFERLALCPTSAALPHASHESEWTKRGDAIHSFLEDVTRIGRDDALKLVDPEWRPTCERLNLDGLDGQLNLAAEVALAYNFVTDTARELGRGEGRKYDDVTIDELPATLDVVGVRQVPAGRRGVVIDWKSGWKTRRRIAEVAQLDVGALLAARAYDLDIVEVQLVHVAEDEEPWIQRRVLEGFEIDLFASSVREVTAIALKQRERFAQNIPPKEFNTGPWCDGCHAREFCPAQATLVRHAINARDTFDGPLRSMMSMTDPQLANLWDEIAAASSILSTLKKRVLGIASSRTLHFGRTPDGTHDRFLGKHRYESNDKLDGEGVFDVIAEVMSDPEWRKRFGVTDEADAIATAATKVTATKKLVDAAVSKAVVRGKGAAAKRDVYAKLAKAGHMTSEWKTTVKEFTLPVGIGGAGMPSLLDVKSAEIADAEATEHLHDEERLAMQLAASVGADFDAGAVDPNREIPRRLDPADLPETPAATPEDDLPLR